MDIEKLNLIKKDILKELLCNQKPSDEFCGLYVDGTGKLTFDMADAAFWSFKVFSEHIYPIYLFVASNNNEEEIKKIVNKYQNTKVYCIPPLRNYLEYNSWMMNYPWFLIDTKHENILTFQDDSAVISKGWEDYFLSGNWDYIGSPWRSDIVVLTKDGPSKTLRVGNGGHSARKRKSIIEVVDYINKRGGQHNYFTGIKINGETKQQNSWLAEDAMIVSAGTISNLLKLPTEEEARKFGHEPIEFDLYMDKSNPMRPYVIHKVDM